MQGTESSCFPSQTSNQNRNMFCSYFQCVYTFYEVIQSTLLLFGTNLLGLSPSGNLWVCLIASKRFDLCLTLHNTCGNWPYGVILWPLPRWSRFRCLLYFCSSRNGLCKVWPLPGWKAKLKLTRLKWWNGANRITITLTLSLDRNKKDVDQPRDPTSWCGRWRDNPPDPQPLGQTLFSSWGIIRMPRESF